MKLSLPHRALVFLKFIRSIVSCIPTLSPYILALLFAACLIHSQTTDKERMVNDIYTNRASSLPYKISQEIKLKRLRYSYGNRIHREKPKIWAEVYELSDSRRSMLEMKEEILNFKCKDPITIKLIELGFTNEITIIKTNKSRYTSYETILDMLNYDPSTCNIRPQKLTKN